MKQLMAILATAAALASCGKGDAPAAAPAPDTKPGKTLLAEDMEATQAPTGANLCLKCNRRTDEDTCPGCGGTLKAKPADAPRAGTAPKHAAGGAGKTAVAAMWICPKTGCDAPPFPTKGACLKHGDTQMVEQLYTCSKCSSEEVVAGNCSGCGDALKATVER